MAIPVGFGVLKSRMGSFICTRKPDKIALKNWIAQSIFFKRQRLALDGFLTLPKASATLCAQGLRSRPLLGQEEALDRALDDRREGFRSVSSSQFHGVFPRHVCCTYWEKLVDKARSTIRYLSARQGHWSICLAQKKSRRFSSGL
jgi:hypothetical protein